MDTLIFNRAFAKFYALAKMQPVYSRTYTITEAKKLLIDFSRSKFTDPKNKEPFLELALSFASYEAQALTFTMEQDSLEFLFTEGYNYFSTVISKAQQGCVKVFEEAFYQLGLEYEGLAITSGARPPEYHGEHVIKEKLKNKALYSYYLGVNNNNPKANNTVIYYKLIEWHFRGRQTELTESDWVDNENIVIPPENRVLIESIPPDSLEKAVEVAIDLMNKKSFLGTDHRDGNALDFQFYGAEKTALKVSEIVAKDGAKYSYYNPYTKKGKTDHLHILFK